MKEGYLYFIKDEFYDKYSKYGLLENKETIGGKEHGRPCCYMFRYEDLDFYWMIPVSSKVDKYKNIFNKSVEKYGVCDNISFGYINGRECAFLPQNMFPTTKNYIKNIYLDYNTMIPIKVPKNIVAEIDAKARKKIRLSEKGIKIGMSDIQGMINELKTEK